MDRLSIIGGKPLKGKVIIGGAKNAALKLMCASLLTNEKLTLDNVPYLADITTMAKLLVQLGARMTLYDTSQGSAIDIDTPGNYSRRISLEVPEITGVTASYDLVRTMRASIQVLGPLLARTGRAKVSLPGGCAIGARPVDLHLKAMEALGATITLEEGYVIAEAPAGGLKGGEICFEKVSVGATENALMAAVLAHGITTIHNAAREPEIADLAHLLNKMGAEISGIGTSMLTIEGVPSLSGTEYRVMPDRIETGTFLCAVAMAGGELELLDARTDTLGAVIDCLQQIGLNITPTDSGIKVSYDGMPLKTANLTTAPFPEFPTDMQAQLMAVLTQAEGDSDICETIFENRFMHVPEMSRMGARISIDGNCATIHGKAQLKGAPVMATDLRASVSLVLAALAAEGETIVSRIYHLDRGYERLEEKLEACGAHIQRLR
jgi:UDP-N-acetylglucosamine 1-carboxyvinyltransferase